MEAKCDRKNCDWFEEVVHMDDATHKLHGHYRASHPTKRFNEVYVMAGVEQWNTTGEEWLEMCANRNGDTNWGIVWDYLEGHMGMLLSPEAKEYLRMAYNAAHPEEQDANLDIGQPMEEIVIEWEDPLPRPEPPAGGVQQWLRGGVPGRARRA